MTNKIPDDISALNELKKDLDDSTNLIDAKTLKAARKEAENVSKVSGSAKKSNTAAQPKSFKTKALLFFIIVSAFAGVGYWYYDTFYSPIPELKDVSPEELKDLRQACKKSIQQVGPQLALALSKQDLSKPTIYISTNLPDESNLEVRLSASEATLLAKNPGLLKQNVKVMKNFAVTSNFVLADGTALPIGEYKLEVTTLADQKTLYSKYIFLGGNKDTSYQSALKQRHDSVKQEILAKLKNLSDASAFLDAELTSSIQARNLAMKVRNPKLRTKNWNDFHKKWMARTADEVKKLQDLKQGFSQKNYAPLTTSIDSAVTALQAVHEKHNYYFLTNDFFTRKQDPSVYELQLKELSLNAKAKIEDLKAKLATLNATIQGLTAYPEGY